MEISAWGSYHLFYHADRNRLLTGLVQPLVRSLLAANQIESFFFIHYLLGGPHVRLRLRWAPGRREAGEAEALRRVQGFFARCPSTRQLAEETIRRQNRIILATDSSEDGDLVHPDNSCAVVPFRPETERYGGETLLAPSLDFFALSSLLALRFAATHGEAPKEQQLPRILRLLLRQAWGLASGEAPEGESFLRLLRYPPETGMPIPAAILEQGDRVFDRQRELFCGVVEDEIATLTEPADGTPVKAGLPGWDVEAARLLARALQAADERTRLRVATSQMHMSANRLGLSNPEEVYLSRIATRAVETLLAADTGFRDRLREAFPKRSADRDGGLPGLLRQALAAECSGACGDLWTH